MAYQPKSYRKFLATSLSAVVAVSAAAPLAASAATTSFTDVPAGAWYAGSLANLVDAGIIGGVGNNKFDPTGEVTRTQLAKMLVYAAGLDENEAVADPGFSDVKTSDWFYKDVAVAAAHGLMNGMGNGTFGVDATLTRDQMATAIVNAFNLRGSVDTSTVTLPYTDLNGSAYTNDVKVLYGLDVLQNTTKYNPSTTVDRQTFVAFLDKTLTAVANLSPKVVSVTPINATQVVVDFNKKVDKTAAEDETNYSLSSVVGAHPTTAKLGEDGMSVTLTFSSAEATDAVFVVEPVATAADTSVKTEKFSKVYSYNDTVRPTVSNITYTDYQHAVVHFSEPLSSLGSVSTSDSNVSVGSLSTDGTSVSVDLSSAAEGSYSITLVGALDNGGNLITPNPVSVSLVKNKTDNVAPTVTGVTTSGKENLTVQFSEALNGNPSVTVSGATVDTITPDSNDPTKYHVTLTSGGVTGLHTVTVGAGYQDPSGNTGKAYSALVEFTADTTAPTYVSSQVKTISSKQYLVVSYNEGLVLGLGAVSGSYVDADQVTHAVANLGTVSLYDADGDGVNESIKVDLSGKTAGNYTVTVPAGIASDASNNAVANKQLSFSLGTVANTTKPTVSSVDAQSVTGSANKITVHYNVDVTAASALNTNNYAIEGQNVFTSAILDGDQKTVTLTLKDGAIGVNGDRYFSVNNIVGVNGVTMDSYTKKVTFTENVKPTITSAKLASSNTVTLTFSENVASLTDGTADFEFYVNGNKDAIVGTPTGTGDTYTFTLTTAVTSLSDSVTLKVLNTNNVTDVATVTGAPVNALSTAGTISVTH